MNKVGDTLEIIWDDGTTEIYMLSVAGPGAYNFICIAAESNPSFKGHRLVEDFDSITEATNIFNDIGFDGWRKVNVVVTLEDN